MLTPVATYEALTTQVDWRFPARLNMAAQTCDDWATAEPERVAIVEITPAARREVTYGALRHRADTLARLLLARGAVAGDRIGVLRSQDAWCAAAHIAIWKIGAISVPLFKLFQRDALAVRIGDAAAGLVITDREGMAIMGDLATPLVADDVAVTDEPFETVEFETAKFETVETGPETPAVLIYTSGTTGAPKGALHGHRMLAGHLPGVEMSHEFLGQPGDCLWTPADWAWIGGLFDVAMPALALGVPVVAARMEKFDAETCQSIIAQGAVKNVFFPPTALRMLKASGTTISGLRTVASGGESLGAEILDWGRAALGVSINEFYGQTECNMVAASCGVLFEAEAGCIGKPAPGFDIAVLDAEGAPTTDEGDVAVKRGAGSMMLGYWNRPDETAAKYKGDWMLTGDRGIWQGDYLRFVGREDDVISSAGYRIGPSEIEDCLLRHPSVATAGVVGKPDALRGEIVKAYVVVNKGVKADAALAKALQSHVKTHLANYSYPREISFLDALPMTVTGKVIRKELKARAMTETETDI